MIIACWSIITSCLLSLGFVNSYLIVFEVSAKKKSCKTCKRKIVLMDKFLHIGNRQNMQKPNKNIECELMFIRDHLPPF